MCHNTSILEADRNKITLCVEHHEEGRENVHNGKIVVIYLEEAPDFPIAVLRKKLNDIKVLHGLVKDSTKLIYETNIKGVSQLYE